MKQKFNYSYYRLQRPFVLDRDITRKTNKNVYEFKYDKMILTINKIILMG